MKLEEMRSVLLRRLPPVSELLKDPALCAVLSEGVPRKVVVGAVRAVLEEERKRIAGGQAGQLPGRSEYAQLLAARAARAARQAVRPALRRVINATGVVLHTNLGRSLLCERAVEAVRTAARHFTNLELDLNSGQRGSRYAPLEPLLKDITGAEDALVVNNNAAAVLLALKTLAGNGEVIVSRGQLVEIGGSFRVPEIMAQSGARLVEVGTTNKTYPEDFRRAINDQTSLLLYVHTSNYRIIGFTRETGVSELAELGREYGLPVMCDLGSGSLVDLRKYGLPYEPLAQEMVAAGADIVTFSGDKLLGGPQAGIIVGKKAYVEKMKKNPLARALRVDKLTVAALEATLQEYLETATALKEIPTLRMLTAPYEELERKAKLLADALSNFSIGPALEKVKISVEKSFSTVGGGAMPESELPTAVVAVETVTLTPNELAAALRRGEPPVVARVGENKVIFDVRTVAEEELELLAGAWARALEAL